MDSLRKVFAGRRGWILPGLLLLAAAALYLPVLQIKFYLHTRQEFVSHARFAAQMLSEPEKVPQFIYAHPLYHFAEIAVMRLSGADAKTAGIAVSTAAYLALAALLYAESRRWLAQRAYAEAWSAALALALLLVSHIPLLLPLDRQVYFGYIGINLYNNATTNFLKPFALAGFLYGLRVFAPGAPASLWKVVLPAALVTCASALVKPNFIICLLPALGALALLCLARRQPFDGRLLLGGFFLPAALTLGWQFFYNYGSGEAGIIFAPLMVKRFYSGYLLPKFLLSILFPLCVVLLNPRRLRQSLPLQTAWLAFVAGVFYAYFLAENSGGNYVHGNFDWSAEITLLILFAVSAWEALRQPEPPRWKRALLGAAFALHLASGLFFYVFTLAYDSYSRIISFREFFEAVLALFR